MEDHRVLRTRGEYEDEGGREKRTNRIVDSPLRQTHDALQVPHPQLRLSFSPDGSKQDPLRSFLPFPASSFDRFEANLEVVHSEPIPKTQC